MNTLKTSLESVLTGPMSDEQLRTFCQHSMENFDLATIRQAVSASRHISRLMVKGRQLVKTEVSQEAATDYRHQFDMAMGFLRRDLGHVAAFESVGTPTGMIVASMEVMGAIKSVLAKLFGKKLSDGEKADVPKENNWQKRYDFLKALRNPTWVKSAEFVSHPITLAPTYAAMLTRGGKNYTDFKSIVAEIKKDLAFYTNLQKKLNSHYTPLFKWADTTWKGCVALWEKHEDFVDYEQEVADTLIKEVTEYILSQVKKRPDTKPFSIGTVDLLGFPKDDWSYTNGVVVETSPTKVASFTIDPVKPEQVATLNALIMELFDLSVDSEVANASAIEGFDDYPWRHDAMQQALDNAIQVDPKSVSFNIHDMDSTYEYSSAIEARVSELENVVAAWLEASVITRP